jgi:molybdate transport system substrate-binding protein
MIDRPWRITAILVASHLSGSVAVADDVLVFAAASTAVALEPVIHRYHHTTTDRVRASYASSGALARQLDNGAPASVYLSANIEWLDWLEKRGVLAVGTRTDLLRNRLVLVQSGTMATNQIERSLTGWLGQIHAQRLAIANPMHAPAGYYARQALASLGAWRTLSRRAVRAPNVRAALLLVEREEAAFGIIYRTDAQSSKAVRILATFPEDSHPPIVYGLAIVRHNDKAAGRRFYEYLKSPVGIQLFRRFGFLTP